MTKSRKFEEKRKMNKSKACMMEYGDRTVCIDPSIPLLSLIGKKYTMLILGVIGNGSGNKNFNEILGDIPFSSSTIISRRLKELQESGLITKIQDSSGIKYKLTELGKEVRASLMPLFLLMENTNEKT